MTREFLFLLKEHEEACWVAINDSFKSAAGLKDIDLFKLSQYKGQAHAFETVGDLENFLSEKLEVLDGKKT